MSGLDMTAMPPQVAAWLASVAADVDRALDALLQPQGNDPGRLHEAMRYAVLGGGKRLRPALVFACAQAHGASVSAATPAAIAVELLHAYTLIHDDLPAMDDDDERRGRPTVHIAFGEATAILAGDALLTLAFEQLASLEVAAAPAVLALARRAGRFELLRGQAEDLAMDHHGTTPTLADVERLAAAKTGALFAAACELGALAAGCEHTLVAQAGVYGLAVGVAFQHADDADDGEFLALAEAAAERRRQLAQQAIAAVAGWPSSAVLAAFARWLGGLPMQ